MGRISLSGRILIGFAAGMGFGLFAYAFLPDGVNQDLVKWVLNPLSNVFLRGSKMLAIPLVFCSIVCGADSIKHVRNLGKTSGKLFCYYLLTTALAATIALMFANLINPGLGSSLLLPAEYKIAEPPFVMDVLPNLIPINPIDALAKGELLQIIVFALVFGSGISLVGKPVKAVHQLFIQVTEIMTKTIDIVLLAAPIGVFALICRVMIAPGVLAPFALAKYSLTSLLVLLLQLLVVYGAALKVLGKVDPMKFFKKYWTVMIIAFSSSSSNAAIPVNLKVCEQKLGVPEAISSLAIPFGAAVSMDSAAIMQGVAAVFLAQMFGVELSLVQQLILVLTVALISIGTAGVPGAGIVMLAMVLQRLNLPVEGISLILSVDQLLDMCRTVVNVTGSAVGAVIVSNSERVLDLELYNS